MEEVIIAIENLKKNILWLNCTKVFLINSDKNGIRKRSQAMKNQYNITFKFEDTTETNGIYPEEVLEREERIRDELIESLEEYLGTGGFEDILKKFLVSIISVTNNESRIYLNLIHSSNVRREIEYLGSTTYLCELMGMDLHNSCKTIEMKLFEEKYDGKGKEKLDQMMEKYTQMVRYYLAENNKTDLLNIM